MKGVLKILQWLTGLILILPLVFVSYCYFSSKFSGGGRIGTIEVSIWDFGFLLGLGLILVMVVIPVLSFFLGLKLLLFRPATMETVDAE